MYKIDIRSEPTGPVAQIVFANADGSPCSAVPHQIGSNASFVVIGGANKDCFLCVRKADVPNLIKALQKAVELGWDK